MSYEEFRRRIDTARNILVGAVPSPAGQIDQITYALMYKFMNDIDDQSAAIPGGKRSYFIGEHEKFNWHKLMASSLGAQERLDLYRLAIQTMSKNENLPPLFREIYQNAFLPFNSANVLNLFLKEMDKFDHGDSDDIGDAYEYLLSITGAQGDVGQFRTPRHIIKFIVDAINPTKDDSVLDPACGTAGFLISAYNHVKSQHDGKDENGDKNNEKRLSADELSKIHKNYHGFDIDPTMVRTAEVNMYLHGFTTPDIRNHDTLSSEDFWNEKYDVILANPPFMTPKGGIQPHKKFSINANRAEVLFVDYIASHINPVSGRAGIVVPEGVIFQSGNAYKQLRKNLVENSLFAVISLPAGVFQPYSGVKTSILLLDKELAAKKDEILFVKIENDGYSLGAQRRKTAGDQFPEALEIIERFKQGEELQTEFAHAVPRQQISDSGDYNLSGDRYKVVSISQTEWPQVPLTQIVDLYSGSRQKGGALNSGVPSIGGEQISSDGNIRMDKMKYVSHEHYKAMRSGKLCKNDVLVVKDGATTGKAGYWRIDTPAAVNEHVFIMRAHENVLVPFYLYSVIRSEYFQTLLQPYIKGIIGGISREILEIKIPLPPIEIQREIVAELDGYQKIIDAAQTIVKTYKPTIKINPDWETAKLEDLVKLTRGITYNKGDEATDGHKVLRANNINLDGRLNLDDIKSIAGTLKFKEEKKLHKDDIFICLASGSKDHIGKVAYIDRDLGMYFGGFMGAIRPLETAILNSMYLYYSLTVPIFNNYLRGAISGANINNLNSTILGSFKIPLPPIEIQREIVAELEAEQKLVNANKKLIEIYQQKIKDKIAEIWGE